MPDLSNYFVGYNLAEPDSNMKEVTDEILTIGRAAYLLPYIWYVRSALPEAAIRDRLRAKMSERDQLLVIAASNGIGFGIDVDLWEAVKQEWRSGFTRLSEPAKPMITQQ